MAPPSQGRNWDRGCGPLFLITVLLEEGRNEEKGRKVVDKMREKEGEYSRI